VLDSVENGETIVITRGGHQLAKLVPTPAPTARARRGVAQVAGPGCLRPEFDETVAWPDLFQPTRTAIRGTNNARHRSRDRANSWPLALSAIGNDDVALSAIGLAELLAGIAGDPDADRRARSRAVLDNVLELRRSRTTRPRSPRTTPNCWCTPGAPAGRGAPTT